MAMGDEWWEYHLTENGWVEGSSKVDGPGHTEKPTPDDRVLTYRIHDYMSPRKTERWTEVRWQHDDHVTINTLLTQFGRLPGGWSEKEYPINT